jgi:hypothetical protein
MNEMLANHYFHARDYLHALEGYEIALAAQPYHKGFRRRLIICCIESGAIQKAFVVFVNLVKEDIDFILNTDPEDDDCPCADLIDRSESGAAGVNSLEDHLRLAMLWLYCDIEKSNALFTRICELEPENLEFRQVHTLIQERCHLLINLPASQR